MRGLELDRSPGFLRSRLALLLLALAGVALITAGCGEEEPAAPQEEELSQEEYTTQVREAIQPIATQSQDLVDQALDARRIGDLSEPLAEAQRVYGQAADELRSIDPPDEVEDLHQQLVQTQENIAEAAAQARRAAEEGDPSGLEQFRSAGEEYRRRSQQLAQEFSERGFEF